MKNRVYESMTRVRHSGCTVRVWATEAGMRYGPRADIEYAIVTTPQIDDVMAQANAIAQALEPFEEISAYEILDERGNGAIVYPDWK